MTLHLEYLNTTTIQPYKQNPRIHQRKQIAQIAQSIQTFAFNNPILIDEKNEIIAGHGRWLAAQELGLSEVPVIQLLHLSDAQKKAYRIADNKLTENGQWDVDLLKLEFLELEALDVEFSLEITGFDIADIDLILDEQLADKNTPLDEQANAVPFVPEHEIVTTLGDTWLLGKHKIICGDAVLSETYQTLCQDKKASMVFTDPPYNVKVDGLIKTCMLIFHKKLQNVEPPEKVFLCLK
jgi:ParB-like chromosome segregation protein Spo0J